MNDSILAKILALKETSLPELQKRYAELYDGKKAPSNNRAYLWQRIAYRIQERAYGVLSDEARDKASELAQEHDHINNKALRPDNGLRKLYGSRDKRLPIPGTVITKNYKGADIRVKILDKGFEYNGNVYRSLTAIAKEVTGAHWSGFLFFNL